MNIMADTVSFLVGEVRQLLKEMLLDGDIHNIVVFTIITSSSVLSVVGIMRHIYTFVYYLRHERPMQLTVGNVKEAGGVSALGVKSADSNLRQNDNIIEFLGNKIRLGKITDKFEDIKPIYCFRCRKIKTNSLCVCSMDLRVSQGVEKSQELVFQGQASSLKLRQTPLLQNDKFIDLSHLHLRELQSRLSYYHMDAISLDLSHNQLTSLPQHLTVLRGLVSLSLRHNQLAHIPVFFSSLRQLRYLDLRDNILSSFPVTLLDLPQLVQLFLDNNSLKQLPSNMHRLQNLQSLSLAQTNLTYIPSSLCVIQSLKVLNFRGNNRLSFLPNSMGSLISLQRLDLSHCDLRQVPAAIGWCMALRQCNLSHNRLTELPCEISQCYRLLELDVSHNQLIFLPATLLFRQGMLALRAAGNKFLMREVTLATSETPREISPATSESPTGSTPATSETPRGLTPATWQVLKGVPLQVPDLVCLSGMIIEKQGLDLSRLPVPLYAQVTSMSSCYNCGQKAGTNCVRAVKLNVFVQNQLVQGSVEHQFPFVFTFCYKHVLEDGSSSLDARLDSLCSQTK